MASLALSPTHHPLLPPPDLNPVQRWFLAASVLVVHVVLAAVVVTAMRAPELVAEPRAMEVALIADTPQVQRAQDPVDPQVPPQPAVAKPAPAQPQLPAPVLAANRPAAPNDVQVAPPAPPVPPKPTETAAPTNPSAAALPAGPTGPVTAAPSSDAGRQVVVPKVLPSSAVRYLVEPDLIYPRASRELGESGVVRLKVLVDEHGRPRDIEVVRSSGYPRLDQQAVLAMKKARFQPHLEDGVARTVWVVAPLTFNLED